MLYLFNYHGYGLSESKTTEAGIYRDADATWLDLRNQGYGESEIITGLSLGAAVAHRHRPKAVVLESSFTSAPDITENLYPPVTDTLAEPLWLQHPRLSAIDHRTAIDNP